MYLNELPTAEGLWKSTLILVKGKHFTEAYEVMKVIAVQTLQSISGMSVSNAFSIPLDKTLDEKEILSLQSLSNEVDKLIQQKEKERAAERITEYLGRIIELLSESQTEAETMYKKVVKALIESKIKDSVSDEISKIYEPAEIYRLDTTEYTNRDYATTSEAAEIGGVSDQTIRRWCEKGKFPGAYQTEGGHWRIPQKLFKVTLQQAREADAFMKKVDEDTRRQLGDDFDEFDIDIDYS
jgi:excisionase family DNA binding protein